ncbi:MAG: hypothetical protein QM640_10485 [Niabella sp.]
MKKQKILFLAVGLLLLAACNFSAGTKKDLRTGLSYHYTGLQVNDVYLSDSAGGKLPGNEVPYNSRVGLVVAGISGFMQNNGKVFPGFVIDITDKDGNRIIADTPPDLFAQNSGFTEREASILLGSVKIVAPLKTGATYHLKGHLWDKNNSDNTVDAEAEIVVK